MTNQGHWHRETHQHPETHRHHQRRHEPPHDCPVCGDTLIVTRLGCDNCGTELSGRFSASAFGAMDLQDRAILTVFLTSRGNMREVAKWLDVSYPTARQRFTEFLNRMGLVPMDPSSDESTAGTSEEPKTETPAESAVDREAILRRLAAGDIDLEQATELLGGH